MKNTKKHFLILIAFAFVFSAQAQQGWWTWMHGTYNTNSVPNYGTIGVPSSSNVPNGGYQSSACWIDSKGNFWQFGGGNPPYSSSLWKYDPLTNMWTWMKGSNLLDQPGVWGTKGIPSVLNVPSARGLGILTWVDKQDNLWLFGGHGKDINSLKGALSDLWKYDPNTNMWTWMSGSNLRNQQGLYGVLGLSSPINIPASRYETNAAWVDTTGNLWLFGGLTTRPISNGQLNDLWKYDVLLNEWVWMKGDSTAGSQGNYGTKGVPAITNNPRSRWVHTRWTDNDGNFWMFGGAHNSNNNSLNDMWKYDVNTNNWTWMSGSNILNDSISLPSKCNPSTNHYPQARYESNSSWKDRCGNLWLFSGNWVNNSGKQTNDIWCYKVQTNEWIFVRGDTIATSGVKGVSSDTTFPPTTFGYASWSYKNEFWMYGGRASFYNSYNEVNTLWKYIPDSTCAQSFCNSLPTSSIDLIKNTNVKVFPNPNTGEFTITGLQAGMNIEIYDVIGKVVYISKINSSEIKINLSEKESGIYFYKITNDNMQVSFGKILIE